ncbi:MAG: hypothetical protein Q7R35_03990 [Elusimicrobiota bacterium]|nr:hypothetical protein [Elusimicrobiota bacterium]
MTETNNNPAQEENGQAPVQPEGELRAELARVRSGNKTLKVVAAVLLSLFIVVAAVAFFVYRKISTAKDAIEQVFQGFPQQPAVYQPENRSFPAAQGVYSSTSMPASSLGLFAGGMPGGSAAEGFAPEKSAEMLKAMNKYADRPIVKEFIADLKKNPEMAAAFAASKGGNPMAVIASMRGGGGIDKMMMKYVTRPEFMKLMMEVMSDPDMKPFMKNLPMGMGMPSGMPPGMSIPETSPGRPRASESPDEEEEGGEITFDPSAISGPAKQAPAASKKRPATVDSD